ncbi:hypothetical protein SAMN05216324_10354 [Chryseobacterium limigenitum]|uniref:Yip1 domain-containing protein n=1 Tax=Chryseobacterium limigenitum TaxID=1612149 RepID=A0A1K2IHP4_9FLAO|nr:hypothetical protein SAMN05216324_10354 [Chryseobacterium limigenitum]
MLTYLDKTYISTDSKIIDFLTKDYPSTVVQNYMESQKKWWWVSYVATLLLIGIKVLLVAFCLNFLKLFDLPHIDKIKFGDFVFLVLIAESIFIVAGFYKFINFHWINTDYTLEDIQTYYPMSLINIKEHMSTEKWLAYPLQLVNLFEVFYWVFLAWGVRELLEEKISYVKSFGLVALTYGIGLLFWVGVVCFFILNAQY